MASQPFDTYAAVKRLSAAGFNEAQAEALIRAVTDSQARADLVTKADIQAMSTKGDLKELELRFIKWMIGLILPLYAIQIAILLARLF